MNATLGLLPEPQRNLGSLITSSICNLLVLGLLLLISKTVGHRIVVQKLEKTTMLVAPIVSRPPLTKTPLEAKVKLPLPQTPKITHVPQIEQSKIRIPQSSINSDLQPLPIDLPGSTIQPTIQTTNSPRIILAPQPKAAMNIITAQSPSRSNKESVEEVHFGTAAPASGGNNNHQIVAATGLDSFRDERTSESYGHVAAANLPTRIAITESSSPRTQIIPSTTKIEVLSGPKPVYTEEAKQLRIQGTVILRVKVTATGRVQVLSVIRGLGHGLDESAITAVEQYRIKPAMQNGIPIDTTTDIIITFQLA